VLDLIEPDTYVLRYYEAEGRTPIWLYVGLYAGRAGSGKGAHHPEACYPAHGWEILHSRAAALPLGDGETLHAQQLEFHQGNAREAVIYWFQPHGRWPSGAAAEQLLRIVDSFAGHSQYAFVRLSARIDGEPGAAARDIEAFASQVAPHIRRAVEQVR
jgi:EpsI family protein